MSARPYAVLKQEWDAAKAGGTRLRWSQEDSDAFNAETVRLNPIRLPTGVPATSSPLQRPATSAPNAGYNLTGGGAAPGGSTGSGGFWNTAGKWVPLALGALSVGSSIYKAIQANQTKQDNKGYIGKAYEGANRDLNTRQGDVRQGTLEDLNRRGLLAGEESSIHAAISSGARQPVSTLGGGVQSDLEDEFKTEHTDLEQSRDRALHENDAAALNTQISAGSDALNGIVNAYTTGQQMRAASAQATATGALPSAAPSFTRDGEGFTPKAPEKNNIFSALLSGKSYGGIHPNSPIDDETSAWHIGAKTTKNATGEPVADFNVGYS